MPGPQVAAFQRHFLSTEPLKLVLVTIACLGLVTKNLWSDLWEGVESLENQVRTVECGLTVHCQRGQDLL